MAAMTKPSPPPPRTPSFALMRRQDRLVVTLDGDALDAGPLEARLPEALVAGLEAVLQTRSWPAGLHRLRLDRAGHRRLGVRHRDGGVEITLLDRGDRRVGPAAQSTLSGFAEAIARFVDAAPDEDPQPASTAAELVRWAEALDRGDRRAVGGGEGEADWRPARRARREAVDRLPVRGLRHVAWRRAWRREAPGLCGVAAEDERLVVFDDAGMTALDRESGAICWHHAELRPVDGPAPLRFALDGEGAPVAIEGDGRIAWRGAAPEQAPIVRVQPAGERALLVAAGEVTALDAGDGRARWRYAIHYGEVAGVATQGPMVWLSGEDGFVHGLRVEDGAERFAVALGGEPAGGPRLCEGGLVVGSTRAPDRMAQVLCLDPASGARRWAATLDGGLIDAPRCRGEHVVCLLDDGVQARVVTLDPARGAVRWQRDLDGAGVRAQLIEGTLYVKAMDGAVDALDPATGALRWRVEGDDPDASLRRNTPLIACRGLILLPGTVIRALDPADGRQVHVVDCGELVPDWMHAWPAGDLAIAEDEAVARYLMGGHLALVA